MKIAIISTFEYLGGASIAARRLCKGLRQIGENAVMLVRDKKTNQDFVYKVVPTAAHFEEKQLVFKKIQHQYVDRNRSDLSNTWFSLPYPGYDIVNTELIAEADVINLHWVAGFQSVENVAKLLKLGKPVVWTLHDENPYTGGCHYTAGCKKYRENCENCKQLKDDRYQLPFHIFNNKMNLWQGNLTVTTPSRWLGQNAKQSKLFGNRRVEVIPNSLETGLFKPENKTEAKKKVGINPKTFTLLFGAHTSNEKRKGFYKLLEAMKYCLKDHEFKKMADAGTVQITTFGPPQEDLEELGIRIESSGFQHDANKLATLYSAADIFVLPSLEDNLPNTMLEAMACGTPVVSFKIGGMPDVIENGENGYMATCFDSNELGECILKMLREQDRRKIMNQKCRRLIEDRFQLKHQAVRFRQLFEELIEQNSPKRQFWRRKYMQPKNGEIILDKWNSTIQKELAGVYRKSAKEMYIHGHRNRFSPRRCLRKLLKKYERLFN
jgi:glycosyltransferase involved in cell wall biosynthesis